MTELKRLKEDVEKYESKIEKLEGEIEELKTKNLFNEQTQERVYLNELIIGGYKEIIIILGDQIRRLQRLKLLDEAIDMGQLFWELYNKLNTEGFKLYNSKERFLNANANYNIRFSNFEICEYWGRATFFGVEEARAGLSKVCELAKGYLVRITLNKSFCWEYAKDGSSKRCRDGWQLFIDPAEKPFDEVFDFDNWLPPYADDRFDCNLELDFSNYSYSRKWIDGVYTFIANVHSKENIESFKNIFPEFTAEVTGNSKKGWEIKIPIYKR